MGVDLLFTLAVKVCCAGILLTKTWTCILQATKISMFFLYQAVEREMHGRDGQTRAVTRNGEELLESVPYASDTIQNRLDIIRNKWERLRDNSSYRKKKLKENVKLQQFIAEYNDITSWLDMTKRVVENDDLGYDEHSAEALIKKHQVTDT